MINSGWAGFRDGGAAPIRGDRDVPCLGVGAGLYRWASGGSGRGSWPPATHQKIEKVKLAFAVL